MKNIGNKQHGFTIIELLIATLVVSMILLLCVYGLAQVSRFFTKGVTTATTQTVARSVLEDITGRIQVEQNLVLGPITSVPNKVIHCIGINRYSYSFTSDDELTSSVPLTSGTRMLIREDLTSVPVTESECSGNSVVANSVTQLLKENMRIVDFNINSPANSNGRLYNVSLKVLYAPDDAALAEIVYLPDPLNTKDVRCSGAIGSEFCGLSTLSTTVFRFNECTYCR